MQTRRDQAQAYRFAQARLQSALLVAEPDRPEPPLRRAGVSTFAGVMVAVLVVAGFGIFGLIRPANKKGWDAQGTLVVEKETGTRFVYDPADQALHPVLNYASARLILDRPDVAVRTFSRASLAQVRRGAPRGLPGAPDALPAPSGLIDGPWAVCTTGAGGSTALSVSLAARATGQHVTGNLGLLVQTEDGRTALIWNDTRLLVPRPEIALPALGLDGSTTVPVAGRWLNAVVPGPDLVAPVPVNLGRPVGYKVGVQVVYLGQVFKVAIEGGVGNRYYVVLDDGLAPVSDVVALLLLGEPRMKDAYGQESPRAYQAQPGDISAAPRSAGRVGVDGLPDDVPQLLDPPAGAAGQVVPPVVCASYTDTTGASVAAAVYLTDAVPGADADLRPAAPGAVRVVVPPGRAVLARSLSRDGQGSDAVYLVTDLGAKHPVPPGPAATALGYGDVTPVPVPKGILDLVPTGATLDRDRANVDLAVAGDGGSASG